MHIAETKLKGAYIIEATPRFDERGSFARIYDHEMFERHGLTGNVAQMSISENRILGTLRGLHWQAPPGRETKLLQVIQGRIYDVVVDLRPKSSQFGEWLGIELSSDKQQALYIPEQCAHGYMTLEDNSHVLYQMSESYKPNLVRSLRWDDPDLNVTWPIAPRMLSKPDATCEETLATLRWSLNQSGE
ncbi:MAG: dTDP-4-dehydrorhamnose 3,5-epimerase family protein [Myxococcales bacterium]|nr:dTDP-4-dehydrorhamnose 3,5-epimerase family protein [Myxococcales bacterium]